MGWLIDFPGFGASPKPDFDWGTSEYADATAAFLETLPRGRRLWIGHSFGCRVGIQLAARYPHLLDGLFLIAAAGIPQKRPLIASLIIKSKIALYKTIRTLPLFDQEQLKNNFGSTDYRTAGEMRGILTNVVGEDLTNVARQITCPVRLIYGSCDIETPPEIGRRFASLIPLAKFIQLDGHDHYSILNRGQHQTTYQVKQFIEELGDCA